MNRMTLQSIIVSLAISVLASALLAPPPVRPNFSSHAGLFTIEPGAAGA